MFYIYLAVYYAVNFSYHLLKCVCLLNKRQCYFDGKNTEEQSNLYDRFIIFGKCQALIKALMVLMGRLSVLLLEYRKLHRKS